MRDRDDREAGIARLVHALRTDVEWRDELTDVAQRANSRPNHSLSDGEVRYPAPDPGTRRA